MRNFWIAKGNEFNAAECVYRKFLINEIPIQIFSYGQGQSCELELTDLDHFCHTRSPKKFIEFRTYPKLGKNKLKLSLSPATST